MQEENALVKQSEQQIATISKGKIPTSLSVDTIKSTLDKVRAFKELIQALDDSELLKDNFSKAVTVDGKTDLVVDTGDVIACMSMAAAVGIDPISAIALGRSFTKTGFMKATMAASMGMNPLACMELFHAIPKGGNSEEFTISIGVRGMQGKALEGGVSVTIVEDFVPAYFYVSIDGFAYLGTNLTSNMEVLPNPTKINSDDVEQLNDFRTRYINAKSKGHIACFTAGVTRRTRVHGKRYVNNELREADGMYELQEAINAGLAAGIKSGGEESKGKPNWTNPKDMTFTRALGRLHKLLSADLFNGVPFTADVEDGEAFEIK